ncbi:hypothetical protein [Streptomyces mangrovisoli]|uniref:Uncharacterized protein n=1 Tax=Streptomyces mangrovisoli TaxID=1428628 RepID=A0A1J4NUF9_9ACTN|nr:hypothetical protein [Streptomyces mangrovisoli]OIJ66079.1 hypothetical protein WN71_020695 [Streptomyces mangrovisoli]
MNANRFHLLLTVSGRPVMHGWWGSETVARGQFAVWVGGWGRPGSQITLTDGETSDGPGVLLTQWPAPARGAAVLAG